MLRIPVLVIGAKGQLARALARCDSVDGHPIVCCGRPDADITAPETLQRLVDELSPCAIVNTAAYTGVDKAEADKEPAFAVNADGCEALARVCGARGLPLIHLSTDYVFDGAARTPYTEADAIAPLGVYGASKAAGETAIRRHCPRHVILRTAWLYSMDGQNFLTTMIGLGAKREELSIIADQHGTPTWTRDVAAAITAILRPILAGADEAEWGTYHLTAQGSTTWFGFATEIFRLAAEAGQRAPRLKAITTAEYPLAARRPAYSVLDCSKIGASLGIRMPAWQESLRQCIAASRFPVVEENVA